MEFQKVYFLGIGGIGMSALARYFLHEGKKVAGYDRTPSHLTDELSAEGAAIHFEDDVRLIPAEFLDPAATMVVYTPAVPQEHGEYRYFADHGFRIEKRSQMLGHLAEGKYVMAVAGCAPPRGRDAPLPDHAFRAGGWPSRPTSSTVRSCGSIPMWRWLRRPTPTTSTFTGRTRR